MSTRQDILAALRAALADMCAPGALYSNGGAIHTTDFTEFSRWEGQGAIVYAWLGPESHESSDSSAGDIAKMQIVVWARVRTDRSAIDDQNEVFVADIKHAIVTLDNATYPAHAQQARIVEVRPNVVTDTEGEVFVVGEIQYYDNII